MIDDIFDFIHRLGHIDSGDYTVDIYLHCPDSDEASPSERVCPCCGAAVPDEPEPLDMAFELEDWLNAAIAEFGKKYGIVKPVDFEKVCGVPASFIEAVDNGEAIKYLRSHK